MVKKFSFFLAIIFFTFFACNSISEPKFSISEMYNLKGNWKLTEIGKLDRNKTFFYVDSSNYNFKKLHIDIDKMNFHLTSFPFENFEPSFPISIINDTIFLLSGTTIENKIVMLKKSTIIYKFSEDHKFLHLQNLDDDSVMIFSR